MEKDFSLDLFKNLKKKIGKTSSRKPETDTRCVVSIDSTEGISQFRQVGVGVGVGIGPGFVCLVGGKGGQGGGLIFFFFLDF